MDASGRPHRAARLRLALLTAVALVGYEYVIYQHWVTSVPLVPTSEFVLPPAWVPGRLVNSGELILFRAPSQMPPSASLQRAVQVRSVPQGSVVAQRATAGVNVAELPIKSGFVYAADYGVAAYGRFTEGGEMNLRPLDYRRGPPIAENTLDSPMRPGASYCLDQNLDLCLVGDTLQLYDAKTDRIQWTLSGVYSVVSIDGGFAFIKRFRPGEPFDLRQLIPTLVSLDDGRLEEDVFPEGVDFELFDVSPDGQFLLYRVDDAFELWSIKQRSRLWSKTTADVGTRELMFSNDSQSVVYRSLDESGTFQSQELRTSDGAHQRTRHERADPDGSVVPPAAIAGSKYAFFYVPFASRKNSDLALWLSRMAMRTGLFVTFGPRSRQATLYDAEAGTPLGAVDVPDNVSLLTASDGSGFAVSRSGSPTAAPKLQFYTLPPRFDWRWWSMRAVGLPLAIFVLTVALSLQRRRRSGKAGSPSTTEAATVKGPGK
jgi:hypothetical protein